MWIVTIQLGVTTAVEDSWISSTDRGFSFAIFCLAVYSVDPDRDRRRHINFSPRKKANSCKSL
ncbi:hypothetical protein FEI15_13885 [Lacticaseibacillus zeae]|uniref:Uncharacterized protein n=1 Tax=Lacticaseibacillus zeae TaxID=57037 RepID=A0A5R8LIU7_LACZE|nr:hypothetical protein FEI15_13885 [Lacticaseibacillus zeae]